MAEKRAHWVYPAERYYYDWYANDPVNPTDGEIKSAVVDRLRANHLTQPFKIKVDVDQQVVILGGDVDSPIAKRSAGDDAWDTPGVVDVSNQIRVPAPA